MKGILRRRSNLKGKKSRDLWNVNSQTCVPRGKKKEAFSIYTQQTLRRGDCFVLGHSKGFCKNFESIGRVLEKMALYRFLKFREGHKSILVKRVRKETKEFWRYRLGNEG